MESEKVALVLIMAMILMANFVNCKIIGYVRPERGSWKRSHAFHHQYLQYPHSKVTKLEGGVPMEYGCTAGECDPFAQDCYEDCFCIPVGLFLGICAGDCC